MSTTYLDTSEAVTQVIANENQIEIPFNFPIYDEKDIEVLKTDGTTGDYVTLALTTDYTVASQYISDVNGQVAGGFITLVTPAIADDKYTCRLNVDIELDTKYTIAGDSMSQSAYVDSQNRVNLQIFQILQQFRRDINNAVTLAPDAVGQASTLPDPADLDAVVNNEANINTVAGNATNINTVANNITNINTANANAGNVNLVAGSIDNMNSVAGSIDNMNSVAGSIDNMNSVAGSIDNMNSVAGSIDNMNSVAGNIGNVNAVVTNQTNINTVAGNITTMQDAINAVPKNNFSATTNPTNANDVNDGYTIGSEWVNINSKHVFKCIDNTASQAFWVKVGPDGMAGGGAGFQLENAYYTNVSTYVGTQVPDYLRSIAFNNDGTKMYAIGSDNVIHQYSLSTSFDLTTVSYSGQSFWVTEPSGTLSSIAFNNDGTKMFTVQGNWIYEYNLSSAFNVRSASYSGRGFTISAQTSYCQFIEFNNDGTKVFAVSQTHDQIFEYNLSSAFNLNSVSYSGHSLNVASEDLAPAGIAFNTDGIKMFILGHYSDTMYQYNLSTPFSINTASYSNISFHVGFQDTHYYGLAFNNDGTKMFVGGFYNRAIYEYSLI